MASVTLLVGGRRYELACRDGEEAQLHALAAVVDRKVADAGRALGTTNEGRQLLLASLLLADELADRGAPSVAPASSDDALDGLAEALDMLAQRLEKLADLLEEPDRDA